MNKLSSLKVRIVEAVLMMFALLAALYLAFIAHSDLTVKFCAAITSVALLSAYVYLFGGAKKAEALYYKIFMICFSVSELAMVALSTEQGVIWNVISAACYGMVVVLTVRKDLGKKWTSVLCSGVLMIRAFGAGLNLYALIKNGDLSGVQSVAELILALVFAVCVYGKYLDKDNRGTI